MPKGRRNEEHAGSLVGTTPKGRQITPKVKEDERKATASAAAQLGKLGGAARAKAITPERRAEIARKAAEKRWRSFRT